MTVNEAPPNGLSMAIAFGDDPDAPRYPDALSASWGDLQVHIGADNLTAFVERGELSPTVTWYTLPILEWLSTNWDFLLHEQRAPQPLTRPFACESPWLTGSLSTGLDGGVDVQWYEWWRRHDLFAAREGGMVPHVCIRRWQDKVEISWRAAGVPGIPPEVRFVAGSGGARLPLGESGERVWRFLNDSVRRLAERLVTPSERVAALRTQIEALQHDGVHQRRRLECLLGLDCSGEATGVADTLYAVVEAASSPSVAQALFRRENLASDVPILPSFLAADLMQTLGPSSAVTDLQRIAQELTVGRSDPAYDNLRTLEYDYRPDLPEWLNGYTMAEQFIAAMHINPDQPVNVERILSTLGIGNATVTLDSRIRGASVWGYDVRPTALINTSVEPYPGHPMRRFAMAHELCHLLDGGQSPYIGMASGSWAPVETERRANAFAAYLLMPPSSVRGRWSRRDQSIPDAIVSIARDFEVSFTAMANHLMNLDLIDRVERENAIEAVTISR